MAQLVKNLPAVQEALVWFLNQEDSPGEGIGYPFQYSWASLVSQMVKNLPAMWETWVPSLGWADPLEEGMAIHSRIIAWRIPKDRRAWRVTVHGVTKSQTQPRTAQHKLRYNRSTIFNINESKYMFILIKPMNLS